MYTRAFPHSVLEPVLAVVALCSPHPRVPPSHPVPECKSFRAETGMKREPQPVPSPTAYPIPHSRLGEGSGNIL